MLLEYLFWCVLAAIVYVYLGYPLAIVLLSKLYRREIKIGTFEPSITILIAAYNEEVCIRKTIENKLDLNYPKERMEIIVISDASTDRTDEIVREFSGGCVRLIRQEPRNGKTAALNRAVQEAAGDILVFSDANSLYEKDALSHLVKNFHDPEVGYVTGKMVYANPDGAIIGDGCSSYMRYENFLRHYETKVGSVVGVDGGIDAVRKMLFQPMRPDQIPDFVLPLRVIEQGFRVAYEPMAVLREQTLKTSIDEYKMRVRVSLRSLWAIRDMISLLNIFKYGLFSLEFISHKILRYLAFMLIGGLYGLNLLLLWQGILYQVIFGLQTLFYVTSYLGYRSDRAGTTNSICKLPYYFVLINLAAAHAFVKFVKGVKQVIWAPRTG
jgi:cellulose synthase/poly-beta-1,6-N-acetylglucosamine synthase-like glycosyltransferase